MQCGNRENNLVLKLFKSCLVALILISATFSVACQRKSQDAAAILAPCQQLLDKDDIQNVGECYQNALAANPKQINELEELFNQSFYKKCLEFKKKENYGQAIICFEGATALRPENANRYLLLAESFYEYNKRRSVKDFDLLEKAEQALNKGLELKPEDAAAYGLYGQILEDKGDLREGLKNYQKASKLAPKVGVYWLMSALTQEKLNDSWGAITSYQQALLINPDETLALYNSGLLYEKLGEIEKAISAYEKLLKIKTSYDDAEERLEKLKKQREDEKQLLKNFKNKNPRMVIFISLCPFSN